MAKKTSSFQIRITGAGPVGSPEDFKCSGEINSPLRKGFAKGKTLHTLRAPSIRMGPHRSAPYLTDHAVGINSLLNCSMAKGSVMPAM